MELLAVNYPLRNHHGAIIFSVLAILIACLGLFGLATFIAEQRTKEIGIRKVLGASVRGIIQLLSKDFYEADCNLFCYSDPDGLVVYQQMAR